MSKDKKPLVQVILLFISALVMGIVGVLLYFGENDLLMPHGGLLMVFSGIVLLQLVPVFFVWIIRAVSPHAVRDYFDTEKFLTVKADAASDIEDYNAMSDYVEQLKQEYFAHARVLCSKEQLESSFENEASVGKADFMNRELSLNKKDYIRVKESCFGFLFELLDIEGNDEVLAELISMHNAWFAAAVGEAHLIRKRIKIMKKFYKRVPFRVRFFGEWDLPRKLGFCEYSDTEFKEFKLVVKCAEKPLHREFQNIEIGMEFLENFIFYSVKQLRKRGKCTDPIFLINKKMTQDIFKRDNNTCLVCGASGEKDDTLFLELEYAKPADPNTPKTSASIRTVCWRCKRGRDAVNSILRV